MSYVLLTAGLVLSALGTLLIVPPLRWLALRQGWVDNPDGKRKLHDKPTPTVGGLAIAGGLAVGLTYFTFVGDLLPFAVVRPASALWIGALAMLLLGFCDDVLALGFKGKFVGQVIVAYFMLHAGYRLDVAGLPFVEDDLYQQALYNIPLTMVWIVGIINAVNLLDGLDGLAAGVALIGFATLGTIYGIRGEFGVAAMALVLVGSLLGFLVYNAHPASIFMGDSGSLMIGFLLATYALRADAHVNPVLALMVPIAALGLPVLDTVVAFTRRLINGKSPFAPDRDHIHHRLTRATSARQAVYVLYGVSLLFGLLAMLMVEAGLALGYFLPSVAAGGAYLWLRKLGYLRVRPSIRTVQQHYDLPLKRFSKNGHEVRQPLQLRGLPAHVNNHLAGKKVAVWELASRPASEEGREEVASRKLIRHLLKEGAFVSKFDPKAGELASINPRPRRDGRPVDDVYTTVKSADMLLVCANDESIVYLQRSDED